VKIRRRAVNKNLDYYMGLPYVIEVVEIPESEGGGFQASLPEIGRLAVLGDGDTLEEAISSLDANKRERFAEYLEKGISIPEPASEDDFSGKFILRIPSRLHMILNENAKRKKLSLNQYVRKILEEHVTNTDILSEIKSLRREVNASTRIMHHEIRELALRVTSLEESYSSQPVIRTKDSGSYAVMRAGAYSNYFVQWNQSQGGGLISSNMPSSDAKGYFSCSLLKVGKRR
jgi:antitoxin HicB